LNHILQRILDLAVAIQQIPAPTFHEGKRAKFLLERFNDEGLSNVTLDAGGNLYACLKPDRQAKLKVKRPIIVSAHMDTVFPVEVDLKLTRRRSRLKGPGIGDNSIGIAGLLGLVWMLREQQAALPGDLWLVANTCEEGLGDLRGMKAVVERFGKQPLAYIIIEGMALGQIFHRGLGVQRYRITTRTDGGHSWIDFGRPSAVHELSRLAVQITGIPVPAAPRTTMNVGKITGGTSINTIAPEASLELDLRSETSTDLQELISQVETLVTAANKKDVLVTAEIIGQRSSGEIPAAHPLVQLACSCLEDVGIQPTLNIGSTDANIPLSRSLPAVCIGLTYGASAHTIHEYIETEPLAKGMTQLVRLVERLWIDN
jgi:acetylornithine deacetylase/succinyl-diaminopimelate desuccinylase-like protein